MYIWMKIKLFCRRNQWDSLFTSTLVPMIILQTKFWPKHTSWNVSHRKMNHFHLRYFINLQESKYKQFIIIRALKLSNAPDAQSTGRKERIWPWNRWRRSRNTNPKAASAPSPNKSRLTVSSTSSILQLFQMIQMLKLMKIHR